MFPGSAASARWRDTVRASGLRATAGRIATLAYLDEHPHSSAAEIYAALGDELPSLSPQSVHNIVDDLAQRGVIRRLDLPDSGSARYETRTGDNHHHVQCIECGRIEDVDCVVGHAPCLTPSKTHGMRIVEGAVTFRAVCHDCEAEDQVTSDHLRGNSHVTAPPHSVARTLAEGRTHV